MKQFKALAGNTSQRNTLLSLPLLAAYLDEHALPTDWGKLTLASFLDHKSIVEDPALPGYYFSLGVGATLNMGGLGMRVSVNQYGLLINILAAGGPGATL